MGAYRTGRLAIITYDRETGEFFDERGRRIIFVEGRPPARRGRAPSVIRAILGGALGLAWRALRLLVLLALLALH